MAVLNTKSVIFTSIDKMVVNEHNTIHICLNMNDHIFLFEGINTFHISYG